MSSESKLWEMFETASLFPNITGSITSRRLTVKFVGLLAIDLLVAEHWGRLMVTGGILESESVAPRPVGGAVLVLIQEFAGVSQGAGQPFITHHQHNHNN